MIKKAIKKVWIFMSSSGNKTYETLQYVDDSLSCNCMGWCRRVANDGSRSCKHTRSVDMGTANNECEQMHDYSADSHVAQETTKPTTPAPPTPKSKKKSGIPVARKISWK